MLTNVNESVRQAGLRKPAMQDRLSLLAAAEAHVLWKNRLGRCIRNDLSESPDAGSLGEQGICRLGNWINGSVFESFCDQDEYRMLTEAHLQFHRCGELIIEKLKCGDRNGAGAIFNNEYSQSLRSIIHLLTEINRRL